MHSWSAEINSMKLLLISSPYLHLLQRVNYENLAETSNGTLIN